MIPALPALLVHRLALTSSLIPTKHPLVALGKNTQKYTNEKMVESTSGEGKQRRKALKRASKTTQENKHVSR